MTPTMILLIDNQDMEDIEEEFKTIVMEYKNNM